MRVRVCGVSARLPAPSELQPAHSNLRASEQLTMQHTPQMLCNAYRAYRNHLCFRLSGTKMFHQELRFCWAVRPTPPVPLPLPLLPSPRSAAAVSSSIDEADVIIPLRLRRSIFACHDERRRFSLVW